MARKILRVFSHIVMPQQAIVPEAPPTDLTQYHDSYSDSYGG